MFEQMQTSAECVWGKKGGGGRVNHMFLLQKGTLTIQSHFCKVGFFLRREMPSMHDVLVPLRYL